jgi:tetratricopeptide (TPR) repeat protein
MRTPDLGRLVLDDGVLVEPAREGNRMVFWLPASRDQEFQYWERIGTVPRAEIKSEHGVCSTLATSVRARQRLGGSLLTRLARRLTRTAGDEAWTLPNGQPAEKCGERKTDLLLAWLEDESMAFNEESARTHWPGLTRFQPIGNRLFLVAGAAPAAAKDQAQTGTSAVEGFEEMGRPVEQAELQLAEARRVGDRVTETSTLIDLGVMVMNEGDVKRSVAYLEEAVELSRQINDKAREIDALQNYGQTLLAMGQGAEAQRVLEAALQLSRQVGDRYAEKFVVERLGMVHANMRQPVAALRLLDKALEMTRDLGDRQQEIRVLWSQAIAHADLNQRDRAIAKAQESIDLLRAQSRPEASWYGAQLQRYRMDSAGLAVGGPELFGHTVMTGGPMSSSVVTTAPVATDPGRGPGLLRMAASATKSMMKFIGSGMQPSAPEVQSTRIATCRACEHHTGVRCRVCGCFTNIKSRLAHEQCPIGKWPA